MNDAFGRILSVGDIVVTYGLCNKSAIAEIFPEENMIKISSGGKFRPCHVALVQRADDVTISKEKYHELLERDEWLACLEEAGVDNWSGYSEAERVLEEYKEQVE